MATPHPRPRSLSLTMPEDDQRARLDAAENPPPFRPGAGLMICPNVNCGYRGPVKLEPRGSRLFAIILLLFLLVPGLLYIMLFSGYRRVCPRCGLQIGRE